MARAYARTYPPEHRRPAYAAAAGVVAIQVPRAKHFVSDLVVGAAIGFAADAAVGWVERAISGAAKEKESREPEKESAP